MGDFQTITAQTSQKTTTKRHGLTSLILSITGMFIIIGNLFLRIILNVWTSSTLDFFVYILRIITFLAFGRFIGFADEGWDLYPSVESIFLLIIGIVGAVLIVAAFSQGIMGQKKDRKSILVKSGIILSSIDIVLMVAIVITIGVSYF